MKSFDIWNEKKKEMENLGILEFTPRAREIWWCSLGLNLGSEQDGVGENFERPIVILRKLSSTTFIVLPLSTKRKMEDFQYEFTINGVLGYVLLDQIKVVDIRRFSRKMGYMTKSDFEIVVQRFVGILYKAKDPSYEGSISEAEAAVM